MVMYFPSFGHLVSEIDTHRVRGVKSKIKKIFEDQFNVSY